MIYWSLLFLSVLGAHFSSAQIKFPDEKSKSPDVHAKDTKADAVAFEQSSSDPSKPSSDPQARFLPFLGSNSGDLGFGGPGSFGGPESFGRPGSFGGPGSFGRPGSFSGQGSFGRPGSFGGSGSFGRPGKFNGQGSFGRPGQGLGPNSFGQGSVGFGEHGQFSGQRPGSFGRPGRFFGGNQGLFGGPGGFGGGFPPGGLGGFSGGFPPGGLGSFGPGPFIGGHGLSAHGTKPGICPRPSVIKDFLGIRSLPGADDVKASNDPKKRTKRQGTHDDGSSPKSNNPQARFLGGPLGLGGLFCNDECVSDIECPVHWKCCFNSNHCRKCANPELF